MDDIIVVGFSERIENLRAVFETCDKFNLNFNPEKCDFFKPEVNFLGLTCSENGILPNKQKTYAIENYPKPHDKEAIVSFPISRNSPNRWTKSQVKNQSSNGHKNATNLFIK